MRDQRREVALEYCGATSDREGTRHDPAEEHDDKQDGDEAELFGDHREQKVGVRFRQIEQLLDTCSQSHPQPLSATECDQCVRELIAFAVRIGPGVHEADDALHAIGRRPDKQQEAED